MAVNMSREVKKMTSLLTILGLVAVVIIAIGFILYAIMTNRIIREQEKEIASLKTKLKREKQKEPLYIIKDGKNPEFGGF